MKPIERLYKKDEIIPRSLHIEENLYYELQKLSENIYDASVSKLVNICVETLLQHKDKIKYYPKPKDADSIYRSILFRKNFYDELIKIKKNTGISFSRLVNGSIKEFLNEYEGKNK